MYIEGSLFNTETGVRPADGAGQGAHQREPSYPAGRKTERDTQRSSEGNLKKLQQRLIR